MNSNTFQQLTIGSLIMIGNYESNIAVVSELVCMIPITGNL